MRATLTLGEGARNGSVLPRIEFCSRSPALAWIVYVDTRPDLALIASSFDRRCNTATWKPDVMRRLFVVFVTLLMSARAAVACGATGVALDLNFGASGVVRYPNIALQDAALQSDGKLIVWGTSPAGVVTLARFAHNGQLDTDFGSGGALGLLLAGQTISGLADLAVQPDDTMVVTGTTNAQCSVTPCKILVTQRARVRPKTALAVLGGRGESRTHRRRL